MKKTIKVDNREQISPRYLMDHYNMIRGDFETDVIINEKYIELKIKKDGKDYARATDEMCRLARLGKECHMIYVEYEVDIELMKTLVGICCSYGIHFHHCYHLDKQTLDVWKAKSNMIDKIKEIGRGKYSKQVPFFKKPSKKLTDIQRQQAVLHGVSESVALKFPFMSNYQMIHMMDDDPVIYAEMMLEWMGVKKNGDPKKIGKDFTKFQYEGGNMR